MIQHFVLIIIKQLKKISNSPVSVQPATSHPLPGKFSRFLRHYKDSITVSEH